MPIMTTNHAKMASYIANIFRHLVSAILDFRIFQKYQTISKIDLKYREKIIKIQNLYIIMVTVRIEKYLPRNSQSETSQSFNPRGVLIINIVLCMYILTLPVLICTNFFIYLFRKRVKVILKKKISNCW